MGWLSIVRCEMIFRWLILCAYVRYLVFVIMQVAIVGFVIEDKDTNYEIRQIKMHALICIDSNGIKTLHNYNLSVIFIGSGHIRHK